MVVFQISETAIVILMAVTLYILFCVVEWAVEKAECWWNKRKENRE